MTKDFVFRGAMLLLGLGLLAGCSGGGGVDVQGTVDAAVAATASAQSRLQATVDAAVAATEVARSNAQAATAEAPAPAPTPVPAVTEPPLPAATAALAGPRCEVASAGLNLRGGPGLVFDPPLRALPRGTALTPLAFVGSGFPSGQWVEVQVDATGQRGWVSAGAQFVTCNVDVATLPPGVAPPTPTLRPPTATPTQVAATVPPPSATPIAPTATPTRVPFVAVLPVDGGGGDVPHIRNSRDVKGGRNILLPGFEPDEVSEPMVFRDRIVFQAEVFDSNVGTTDGAGIDWVRFTISDESGVTVHQRTEYNAAYCVFGGGEPDCVVWRFSENYNRWPGGATVRDGLHNVEIVIQPKLGEPVSWFWSFRIERP